MDYFKIISKFKLMLIYHQLSLYLCAFVIICPPISCVEASDVKGSSSKIKKHKPLPMKGESGINYGNLQVSEPGFDITDEEINKLKIWPQGIIPYFVDDLSFDKVLRDRLRAFLEHTNTIAGVHFAELSQPPADDARWAFFINRRSVLPCADLDFRKFTATGVQKVVIGYDCMEPGNLAEVVLALVGVPPQHNAPDRDKFVVVEKQNILPDKQHLFEKFSDSEWLFHDIEEYDFLSTGHYPYHKYTANGSATLKPVHAVDIRVGEATTYSFNDIWKIRMLYSYISKKRQNSTNNLKICSKIFKPGAKFREFTPNKDDVKPRPKPSKYTGIPEEEIKTPDYNYDYLTTTVLDENNTKVKNKQERILVKLKRYAEKKPRKNIKKEKLYLSDIQTDE